MNLNEELIRAVVAGLDDHNRVLQLIRHGADVQYSDSFGETALLLAVWRGHPNICEVLLKNGANPNPVTRDREWSALTQAICDGNEKIVLLLLKYGADPNLKLSNGETALDEAMKKTNIVNCTSMLTLLLKHGADANNVAGKLKPLHWACEGAHLEMVEILLKKGANTKALNEREERPMHVVNKKSLEYEKISKAMNEIKIMLKGSEPAGIRPYTLRCDAATAKSDSTGTGNKIACSHEDGDSDSDATVDYSDPRNDSFKPKLTSRIMDLSEIEEFQEKMAQLSALVVELNEKAVNFELLELNLSLESDTVANLTRQIEKTTFLKSLNSKTRSNQEDSIIDLTRKVDQSKRKEAQLKEEMITIHTEISSSRAKVNSLHREISRCIKP